MSNTLTPAAFAEAVGGVFTLHPGDGAPDLELVLHSLVEHTPSLGAPRERPFSLTFLGPPGQHLAQGTYTMQHAGVGEVHLFLVALGPAADGRHQYEAAFN